MEDSGAATEPSLLVTGRLRDMALGTNCSTPPSHACPTQGQGKGWGVPNSLIPGKL